MNLAVLQMSDHLDAHRREAHGHAALLDKTQQVEAAEIVFRDSSRPHACVGDLDQRHCFLRAQLDGYAAFQRCPPGFPVKVCEEKRDGGTGVCVLPPSPTLASQ